MKKYYIGVDLGGTNTKIALIDKKFKVLESVSIPTKKYRRPERLLGAIYSAVNQVVKARKAARRQIFGVGVGVAGLVDAKSGVICNLVNIPGWKNLNLKKILRKKLRLPIYCDNDVNVMALAESSIGAGKGSLNVVCLTLGTGVGGGIIINGNLYRGSTSSAGEIGHIPINEGGPGCNCGGQACLESYVGNHYLVKEVRRRIKAGKRTVLKKMANKKLSDLTPRMMYKAAKSGDRFARDLWHDAGVKIGIALSGVVNFLDPDKVVIGGGVSQAGAFLFKPIRETVRKRSMELQGRHVRIVKAALGKDAGVIGAAVLVAKGTGVNR